MMKCDDGTGRVLMIFGGLMLLLTVVTMIIVVYTDRKLKQLNKQFVQKCVKILEKEKIVTWGASFQHLLFDIIYPYNGRSGAGAVILTPNPYFEMVTKTTDDQKEMEIKVHEANKKMDKLPMPMPKWVVANAQMDESVSRDENAPPIGADVMHRQFGNDHVSPSMILPPSDDSFGNGAAVPMMELIPPVPVSESESDSQDLMADDDNSESDKLMAHHQREEREDLMGKKDEKQAKPAQPYTGFDNTSKEIAQKVHGDLAQAYFLDAPEEMEGWGQDTQLDQLKEPADKK